MRISGNDGWPIFPLIWTEMGWSNIFRPVFTDVPVLTSYIIAIGHEAGWSIPDETRAKMETGLRNFIEGKIWRYSPLATADLSIKKLSAIEALSRSGKAQAKLLNSISIEPNLWPTSAVIDC